MLGSIDDSEALCNGCHRRKIGSVHPAGGILVTWGEALLSCQSHEQHVIIIDRDIESTGRSFCGVLDRPLPDHFTEAIVCVGNDNRINLPRSPTASWSSKCRLQDHCHPAKMPSRYRQTGVAFSMTTGYPQPPRAPPRIGEPRTLQQLGCQLYCLETGYLNIPKRHS